MIFFPPFSNPSTTTKYTAMPLFKKKIYHLSPSPKDLKASEELFVIPETKECFRSYEYLFMMFLIAFYYGFCITCKSRYGSCLYL